ncbi:MAG: glycosyltransferase family 2 protein [Terriglobia bacterium]
MSGLSVVIVNYQSGVLLQSCLTALRLHDPLIDDQILVVNNGSPNERSFLEDFHWPKVRWIQSPSNLGFACAANCGYRCSQSEFVLLLNPDVEAKPQSVHELLQAMRDDQKAGIVLPQLRNPDESLQYSCRTFYTYPTLFMRRGPWKRWFSNHRSVREHLLLRWDHQSLRAVDWGLGAAMLIRREAAGNQLFDERFFLYFEDVDLCVRMWETDWKVLYNPGARMIHHHRRESARPLSLKAKEHHFLSLMKFLWKQKMVLPKARRHVDED